MINVDSKPINTQNSDRNIANAPADMRCHQVIIERQSIGMRCSCRVLKRNSEEVLLKKKLIQLYDV
jgi:hypothetical protein